MKEADARRRMLQATRRNPLGMSQVMVQYIPS